MRESIGEVGSDRARLGELEERLDPIAVTVPTEDRAVLKLARAAAFEGVGALSDVGELFEQRLGQFDYLFGSPLHRAGEVPGRALAEPEAQTPRDEEMREIFAGHDVNELAHCVEAVVVIPQATAPGAHAWPVACAACSRDGRWSPARR